MECLVVNLKGDIPWLLVPVWDSASSNGLSSPSVLYWLDSQIYESASVNGDSFVLSIVFGWFWSFLPFLLRAELKIGSLLIVMSLLSIICVFCLCSEFSYYNTWLLLTGKFKWQPSPFAVPPIDYPRLQLIFLDPYVFFPIIAQN